MNTPNPQDRAEIITNPMLDNRGYGLGVQILHDGDPVERYAVVMSPDFTRVGVALELRRLADAIMSGKGAVMGEVPLRGNELNASDFPPEESAKRVKDIHSDDFSPDRTPAAGEYVPLSYEDWRAEAMRALDRLTKTRPVCLP